MADQNITELPVKTSSGITSSDYMLGIDSAEGYQMLIRDLGDYIIRNVQVNSIAGSNQTLKSALDTLNSNWVNIDTSSELNSKLSALPTNRTVNTLLQGAVTAVLTNNMASSSGKGYMTKISVTSVDYTIMTGAGDFIFIGRYNFSDGTITNVQKVPTRDEVDSLNSNLATLNGKVTLTSGYSLRVISYQNSPRWEIICSNNDVIKALGISDTGIVYEYSADGGSTYTTKNISWS